MTDELQYDEDAADSLTTAILDEVFGRDISIDVAMVAIGISAASVIAAAGKSGGKPARLRAQKILSTTIKSSAGVFAACGEDDLCEYNGIQAGNC